MTLRSLQPLLFAAQDALITDIALASSGDDHSVVLIGTTQGLYLSRDTGTTWEHQPFAEISALAVSPDYAHDQTIFATALTKPPEPTSLPDAEFLQIYESNDAGHTWTATELSRQNGWNDLHEARIAISPTYAADETVFVYAYLGDESYQGGWLFHSTDGGNTWTSMGTCPLTNMLLSPTYSQDHTLLAECTGVAGHSSSANGIHRSTDGFVTSKFIAGSSPSSAGLVLAFEDPDFLTQEDIIDGWPKDNNLRITIVRSPAYAHDQLLFAMVQRLTTADVVASYDHGQTWQPIITDMKVRGLNPYKYWNIPTFAVTKDGAASYRILILHEQRLWIAHISA